MRFSRWVLLFIGSILFIPALIATAQDINLSESYTFSSNATFQYPSDWTLDDDPHYLIDIHSDTTQIYFMDYADLRQHGVKEGDNLADAAHAYFSAFYGNQKFQASDVQDIKIGDRDAVRYDYKTPDKNVAFILVVPFNDDTFGLMEAVSTDSDFPEEDIVLAVAATFDIGEGGATPESTETPQEVVACTVSTSSANAVHIRVGPGTNRTSFAFLPTDTDFTVLGQATAKDDSVWYKLDKDAVAPGKSAAEAWVAAKDVDSTGDCTNVVDVNAPPIVPIVAAPPPSTGGGDTGGGTVTGGAEPSPGSWTINYAPTAPGSCLGTGTVNIPLGFSADRVTVSGSGSTITFAGDTYTRIQPGVYQGLFSAPDGSSVLLTLRVASSTVMGVEFILTFSEDNTQCSITVNGTATHN